MHVVVQIQSGPQSDQKVQLREQQLLVFGRTQWSDVAFPHDTRMSAKHFLLDAQHGRLQLSDLGSANGTTVNHQPVQNAWISDGDIIVAGETRLSISIDGAAESPASRTDETVPFGMADPGVAATSTLPCTVAYTRETCASGLTRLRGGEFGQPGQPAAASQVAGVLAQSCPMTVLVDPQKFEQLGLDELPDAEPLFDWLPDERVRQASPLILPPGSHPSMAALIDAGWDKNVILCFFSSRPADELVQHLREAVRIRIQEDSHSEEADEGDSQDAQSTIGPAADDAKASCTPPATQTQPDTILGYCWPNVLSPLLDFGCQDLLQRLLDGIDLVLMEVPDQPGTWQLVSPIDCSKTIERAGFSER